MEISACYQQSGAGGNYNPLTTTLTIEQIVIPETIDNHERLFCVREGYGLLIRTTRSFPTRTTCVTLRKHSPPRCTSTRSRTRNANQDHPYRNREPLRFPKEGRIKVTLPPAFLTSVLFLLCQARAAATTHAR